VGKAILKPAQGHASLLWGFEVHVICGALNVHHVAVGRFEELAEYEGSFYSCVLAKVQWRHLQSEGRHSRHHLTQMLELSSEDMGTANGAA
jgi:hypothetical protein